LIELKTGFEIVKPGTRLVLGPAKPDLSAGMT
jgi:hypothetical protein